MSTIHHALKSAGEIADLCKIIVPAIIFSLLITGCGASEEGKIGHQKMVTIYADVLIVTSAYDDAEEPPDYFEQLDSVFISHNITREIFFETLDSYRDDPNRWKRLLDNVITELEKRRDQVSETSPTRSSS